MPFFDKVIDILGSSFIGKVLDKVPDAGSKAQLLAELDKEKNRAAEEIQKLYMAETQQYLADVANARAMQVAALGQDDKFSKRFTYYLAGISILLGFSYIYLVTFMEIPASNQRFADTILGVVISLIFGTIYNFFYGSSKSSQQKSETLQNVMGNILPKDDSNKQNPKTT